MRREVPPRIARLNPGVTTDVMSGSQWIAPVFGPLSVAAWIIVGFGTAALLVGSIGFFSLLDYAVQHRIREIGIRRALGAHTWDVVRSLVEPTARPLIRGLLIGTAGAMAAGAFMRRADLPTGVNAGCDDIRCRRSSLNDCGGVRVLRPGATRAPDRTCRSAAR